MSNDLHHLQHSEPPPCPFGPAWRIPPDEQHLWSRNLLNMMQINREGALGSLLRVRDANFVRNFQDFAKTLRLKDGNYLALRSKKDINEVADMIRTTLKSSVLSVQSLVWRTGRFRRAVALLQRWVRARLAETRAVKVELKIRWRQQETRARERIHAEIERRNALHFGAAMMEATSMSASSSNANASLAAAAALLRRQAQEQSPNSSSRKRPDPSPAGSLNNNNNNSSSNGNCKNRSTSPAQHHHHHSVPGGTATSSAAQPTAGRRSKRRSPAEQRINDLLWSLLSDAWMDDDVMDAAIFRLLMHRRCRYVDCFRVWRATSLRDFRARSATMTITRTAMKLLECAMSLRFPRIQFTVEGVSIDELAYHAIAHQMQFPTPKPSVPPARPFLQFMKKNIWEVSEDESEGEEDEAQDDDDAQNDEKKLKNGDDNNNNNNNNNASSAGGGDNASISNNSDDAAASMDGNKDKRNQDRKSKKQKDCDDDDNDDKDRHGKRGVSFADDQSKLDLSTCSFNPAMVRREPQPMLPTKSMCFRAEKKDVAATINEAFNTMEAEEKKESNSNDDQQPQRTGWTQEEIAEMHEKSYADPISMVRRQTTLPIHELSGGIEPPFNFYHSLLSFRPDKIFFFAFLKQAVSGRRVLLESQLHGRGPREQCEEAIRVIRVWVYLRTVRALSSDEIVSLDITPRARFGRDGTPVARVISYDEKKMSSPTRARNDAGRLSGTVDRDTLRVAPPRSLLMRLLKPDVAASTSRLSTIFSVQAVPGVTTDTLHVKPYESVFIPHGTGVSSATDVVATTAAAAAKSETTAKRTPSPGSNKNNSSKKIMTTQEMAKALLSGCSPFRAKAVELAAAAAVANSGHHGNNSNNGSSSIVGDSNSSIESRSAATPTPNAMMTSGSAAATEKKEGANNNNARQSSASFSSRHRQQQQQHHALSARTFPVNLPGLRSLMPPPVTAAVVSAPPNSARLRRHTTTTTTTTTTTGSIVNSKQPAPPQTTTAVAAARTKHRSGNDDDDNNNNHEQPQAPPQTQRHRPEKQYINMSGFMCTQEEYLEREIGDRRDWEQRYVEPIRQRRNLLNNRMFVSSQRRAHAVEAKLKVGVPVKVEKWNPGD